MSPAVSKPVLPWLSNFFFPSLSFETCCMQSLLVWVMQFLHLCILLHFCVTIYTFVLVQLLIKSAYRAKTQSSTQFDVQTWRTCCKMTLICISFVNICPFRCSLMQAPDHNQISWIKRAQPAHCQNKKNKLTKLNNYYKGQILKNWEWREEDFNILWRWKFRKGRCQFFWTLWKVMKFFCSNCMWFKIKKNPCIGNI